ncbi:MAG: UDP-2,3-diacylglucosamine diphosphatase LpxI [Verrucomicrobiota bacterium]|nr:UDP-2,3-diacylglucosamine diphosphatase LpxI [Verrucomicrobiota bacterium]
MQTPAALGIIAGSGVYPRLVASSARAAGVGKIVAAAFNGETDPSLTSDVETIEWMRVGQLARMIDFFREAGVRHALMAGQIAPKNLFDLRPDWKALLLLARLKRRNAETIFGGIADELAQAGIELLPATSFLEDHVASSGLIVGRKLSRREEADVDFGFEIAREVSRLDIGQTVIVKGGTVLAVEAFEGTNEALKRGAELARKDAVMVKVSKPKQDMRFDVPVIGLETMRVAADAKVRVIAVEAGRTLLLEKDEFCDLAARAGISIIGRQLQSMAENLQSAVQAGS